MKLGSLCPHHSSKMSFAKPCPHTFTPSEPPDEKLNLFSPRGSPYHRTLLNTTPSLEKIFVFFLTPEAPLISKPLIYSNLMGCCPDFHDFQMDFDGNAFYKSLASSLHPAGAFSSVKTAFLKIFNMSPNIFEAFLEFLVLASPW